MSIMKNPHHGKHWISWLLLILSPLAWREEKNLMGEFNIFLRGSTIYVWCVGPNVFFLFFFWWKFFLSDSKIPFLGGVKQCGGEGGNFFIIIFFGRMWYQWEAWNWSWPQGQWEAWRKKNCTQWHLQTYVVFSDILSVWSLWQWPI